MSEAGFWETCCKRKGGVAVFRIGVRQGGMDTVANYWKKWILTTFLPISFALCALLFWLAQRESSNHMTLLRTNQNAIIDCSAMTAGMEIESLITGLRFLEGHDALKSVDLKDNEYRLKSLEREFQHFSISSKKFDQVRILNMKGMEVLRINFDNGKALTVPAHELQDKSNRYYFKEAIGLDEGELYVSPLDLNKERGQVELPYKPMLRVATPFFDKQGQKIGLLVVNYFGAALLNVINNIARGDSDNVMLLNAQGQWLFGGPPGCDWAFMFPDKKQCAFGDGHPEAWGHIVDEQAGQFLLDTGLYTFQTISVPPKPSATEGNPSNGHLIPASSHREWKLVSYVSAEDVSAMTAKPYMIASVTFALLLVGLFLTSIVLHMSKAKRLKALEEMFKSEQRLREAEKIAHLGSWESDLEHSNLVFSDGAYRNLGYEPGEAQLSHEMALEHVIPEDRDAFLQWIGGEHVDSQIEFRILRKDGALRHMRARRKVVQEKGQPGKAYGTVLDLTEQIEQTDELQRLWNAIEHCPASIVITDSEANIQYVNPFFTVISGYAAEEAIGNNPRILQSGHHSIEFYEEMWATLITGKTWRGEFCNKKKCGEIYWESATISPIRDSRGKISHYIGVKEDITERKRQDAELRQALSEFEALFENSSVGIAYLKGGRVFHRVNQRFCEITGYSPDDLLGKTTQSFYLNEEAYEDVWPVIREKLLASEVVQFEIQLRHKSGRIFWALLTGTAVSPPDIEAGIIWVLDDISARKELEKMREDVERIMRHDLKAPLNGIINLPMLIEHAGGLNDDQIENLQLIEEAGRRMLNQINLSLNLYKIETGAYEYEPAPVDLVPVVRRLTRELDPLAESMGATMDVYQDGSPLADDGSFEVQAEESFCYNMISNVLKNALEASPSGARVKVYLESGETSTLRVHNVGAVPPEMREVFFEKYSTFGKKGGVGLGTYSVRLLAEAQGITVVLDTSEGDGTSIIFTFPNV